MNQLHNWRQQLEENQAAYYHQNHLNPAVLRRVAEQAQERAAPPPPQQEQQPPQQQPVRPAQDPEEQHDLLDVFYLIIRLILNSFSLPSRNFISHIVVEIHSQ